LGGYGLFSSPVICMGEKTTSRYPGCLSPRTIFLSLVLFVGGHFDPVLSTQFSLMLVRSKINEGVGFRTLEHHIWCVSLISRRFIEIVKNRARFSHSEAVLFWAKKTCPHNMKRRLQFQNRSNSAPVFFFFLEAGAGGAPAATCANGRDLSRSSEPLIRWKPDAGAL